MKISVNSVQFKKELQNDNPKRKKQLPRMQIDFCLDHVVESWLYENL